MLDTACHSYAQNLKWFPITLKSSYANLYNDQDLRDLTHSENPNLQLSPLTPLPVCFPLYSSSNLAAPRISIMFLLQDLSVPDISSSWGDPFSGLSLTFFQCWLEYNLSETLPDHSIQKSNALFFFFLNTALLYHLLYLFTYSFIACLPWPLEGKLREDRNFCLFYSLLYPRTQSNAQHKPDTQYTETKSMLLNSICFPVSSH